MIHLLDEVDEYGNDELVRDLTNRSRMLRTREGRLLFEGRCGFLIDGRGARRLIRRGRIVVG